MSFSGDLIKSGILTDGKNITVEGNIRSSNLLTTRGKIWYVHSGVGSDVASRGKLATKPFATLDYAVGKCTASRGDIIYCLPGHTETITAAAGLALDVVGITVVFLGEGENKATITFTTSPGADMDVDADDIMLVNPRFLAGVDALVGPIDINAADFKILNGEYHDATDIETTDCIIGDANAARFCLDGWKYFKANEGGTQKQSHIQLDGLDDLILRNLHIEGDFDIGIIEIAGTDECLRMTMEDHFLKNTDPGNAPCATLDSGCSGWARRLNWRNTNGTVVDDVADINWAPDAIGYTTDGYGGDPIGTAAGSGVEGKIDTIDGIVDTIYSDTTMIRSDTIGIMSDLEVIMSDVILMDLVADKIYSDTTMIRSDTTGIMSDLETIMSDVILMDLVVDKAYSDTTMIRSDTVAIMSDLETIASDLLLVDAVVDKTYSDTTMIRSDTIGIMSDLETIASDLLLVDGVVDTIYSDTTMIRSDTIGIMSDLETIASDLLLVDAVVDTLATRSIRVNTVDLAAGDMTGTVTRFTISGGPILVRHLGKLVTTAIGVGANTLKFSFTPTGGGATDLSGATDTASAGLRQIFTVDGVKVTGLVKNADVGIGLLASEVGMPLVLGTGVIQTVYSAGAPGTGAATLFMQWEPLAAASAVV